MMPLVQSKTESIRSSKESALSAITVFQQLPFISLCKLERVVIERKFDRKETIFQENDPALSVWVVKQGHVKEVHHSSDGKTQTVSLVGSEGLFGLSSFEGGNYGFHGVAETAVTAVAIPVQRFRALMIEHPIIAQTVITKLSKLLRESKDRQTVSQECAEKRLLHALLEMSKEFGSSIPLTQRALASMAGISTETCSRLFSQLIGAGLIQNKPGNIILKSIQEIQTRIKNL